MHSVKVLVSDSIHEEGLKVLRDAQLKVDTKFDLTREGLVQTIADYDVLVVRSRTQVTREVLDAAKRLKVVARAGVGLDNIDVASAQGRGVILLNAPEPAASAVAELTVGLILSVLQGIMRFDRNIRGGKKEETISLKEVKGKTLGVIGFGRIGSAVADKMKVAFGMRVLAYDPVVKAERMSEMGVELVELDELLRKSDVITIHAPLTKETRGLIDEKRIGLMKKGAYLINTSRGGIVSEESLLKALKSGVIAGAALDVFESEPPTNLALVQMPNVVCTPHIGAQTSEAQKEISVTIARKVVETVRSGFVTR